MRFRKGIHYAHPPRGPGRGRYHMSDEARRARRANLSKARLRSDRESRIIKLLAWQSRFDRGRLPSERTLASQLGVWRSYVHKLLEKAHSEGMEALLQHGERVTLDNLAHARSVTARVREQLPGLLAPAPQTCASDERHCATAEDIQREAQEMIRQAHRQNPGPLRTMQEWRGLERRGGRRVAFSVLVR